jgi:hypothetical protein
MPTIHNPVEATLARAESGLEAVASALLLGRPDAMESAARALHQAAVELTSVVSGMRGQPLQDPSLTKRIEAVSRGLVIWREACLRRCAVVERSLHSILPATRNASTYGGPAGPYARNARQSGAFKVLTA